MVALRYFFAVLVMAFSLSNIYTVTDKSDMPLASHPAKKGKGVKKLLKNSIEPLFPLVPSLNRKPVSLAPIKEVFIDPALEYTLTRNELNVSSMSFKRAQPVVAFIDNVPYMGVIDGEEGNDSYSVRINQGTKFPQITFQKSLLKPLISRNKQNNIIKNFYCNRQLGVLQNIWAGKRALIEDKKSGSIQYGVVQTIKYDKEKKDFYVYLETKKSLMKGMPATVKRVSSKEVTVLDW